VVIPPELLAKLDDCAKTDFTSARDLWFSRQWWASAFVIAGLVLEGPELWYEMVSIARSRIPYFRYRIVLIESRLELAKVLAFVGWIFIVGGLFGELKASSRIADLSASIQECSDAKVEEATQEAGDAAVSAKTAHEEAAAVKGIADASRKDALSAKNQSAAAELHLGEAHKEASAAQAELNRLKTPRSLTNVDTLVSALERFKGIEFSFIGIFGDQESIALAGKINNALQRAGWKATTAPNSGMLPGPWFRLENFPAAVSASASSGVHISAESKETPDKLNILPISKWPLQVQAALALQEALAPAITPADEDLAKKAAGKAVEVINNERITKFTRVLLDIGKKP
jgi:hypothetical protein